MAAGGGRLPGGRLESPADSRLRIGRQKEPPCLWPSTKPTLATERATSLLGCSVLILVLVGARGPQVPSERPNTLFEAEMQHELTAPIMEKNLRYTHRLPGAPHGGRLLEARMR